MGNISINKTGLENIINENVVIITNDTRELNVFAEHELTCIYTSNTLNTVEEIKNLKSKE